jgi:hypothetical protein
MVGTKFYQKSKMKQESEGVSALKRTEKIPFEPDLDYTSVGIRLI